MTDNKPEISALIKSVDEQLKNVHTTSLDISFNELADMINSHELDISPDYQRLFRWTEGSRSRFIESLLLEMPVPPLYVVEEEDNSKLLIDGLQRLSSYLHFRGMLDAQHLPVPVKEGDFLVLQDCDIVPALNGKKFDDLGTALQIKLKRSFVRVEVVRKGSHSKFKYHMFKRLNTGGEALTPQQLRNCTIRLLDPKFNNFIIEQSKNRHFKQCISTISDEQILGAYDQELVLRFFAFKNWRDKFKHDVADFLTEYLEDVSDPDKLSPFNYQEEAQLFDKTFLLFAKTLGDKAFGRANKARNNLIKGFGIYHFEAFGIGIQAFINNIDIDNEVELGSLKELLRHIKLDPNFVELTTGGGKNSPGPLNARIKFVEEKIRQHYGC